MLPFMRRSYDRYWETLWSREPIRRALLASLAAHLVVVLAVAYVPQTPPQEPKSITYQVDFIRLTEPRPEPPEEVAEPEPPKPEPPKPPPPEPEPEPEPKKPEPAPPEPKKVVKKDPPPEPKPKPEPPKPEPKKETKPDPPKPTKVAKAETPPVERLVQKAGPKLKQQLPSELQGWAGLVRKKVDRLWTEPGGVRVGAEGIEAVVSFWVDKQGRLIGEPEIVVSDASGALAASGVRALKAANPFPPLPPDYRAREQQVFFAFTMN